MNQKLKARILAAVAEAPIRTKDELAKVVGGRRQTTLQAIDELVALGEIDRPAPRGVLVPREIRFAPTKGELKRWQQNVDQADLLERIHEGLIADLKAEGKRRRGKRHKSTKGKGSPLLLEVAPVDLHVGKYSWDDETGFNYDVTIAERVFTDAIEDIIERAARFGPNEALLVAGNDLLQTDNLNGTTTAGTYVDTDTRYIRSYRRAFRLFRWAIDRLAETMPVKTVIVPGNHDRLTAFTFGHSLEAYYHDDPRVTIDNNPKTRKYHLHGTTLLGFTHGDKEKHDSLPNVMAVEEPALWAQSRHRVWHLGHEHKKKELRFVGADTHNGVQVQVLQALCPPDAWHYENGYVGGVPACEAFLWDAERGPVASFTASTRPDSFSRASSPAKK